MIDQGPETRIAEGGSVEHNQVVAISQVFQQALSEALEGRTDPHELALAMTAASMFAGTIAGTLISVGLLTDKDKRRVTEMMARNFRSGIDVGKRRAMRIAEEQFGVGHA